MRLINTSRLELKEFFDQHIPEYAILSHCWASAKDEVTFQQLQAGTNCESSGFAKIEQCCRLARETGIGWVWVDTCCKALLDHHTVQPDAYSSSGIDKTSSAELSEAINSMFAWYKASHACYVFLPDVQLPANGLELSSLSDDYAIRSKLRESRYFQRGWTLQELLAPESVLFYDSRMRLIGARRKLASILASITGIDYMYLSGTQNIQMASVAQRMSWASNRVTTRTEDMAYCLLGLFDVNMPLLYGEGPKAFQRLQEAIIQQSDDESIFAWISDNTVIRGLLAESPREFARCGAVRQISYYPHKPPNQLTSRGIVLQCDLNLRQEPIDQPQRTWWAPWLSTERASFVQYGLNCAQADYFKPERERPVVLLLGHRKSTIWGIPTYGWYRAHANEMRVATEAVTRPPPAFTIERHQIYASRSTADVVRGVRLEEFGTDDDRERRFLHSAPSLRPRPRSVILPMFVAGFVFVSSRRSLPPLLTWVLLTGGMYLSRYKKSFLAYALFLAILQLSDNFFRDVYYYVRGSVREGTGMTDLPVRMNNEWWISLLAVAAGTALNLAVGR